MTTEISYKVISGLGNNVEEATDNLKQAVNNECSNGWDTIGCVLVAEKLINKITLIQVITNNLSK